MRRTARNCKVMKHEKISFKKYHDKDNYKSGNNLKTKQQMHQISEGVAF